MMRIVFASKNMGKIREARRLLSGAQVELLTLGDFSTVPPIAEDGETFAENALQKAVAVAEATGEMALADDSGLVVEFLGGAPGVRSARYAGEDSDDERNIAKVLAEMHGVPLEERGARFVCCLALYKKGQPPRFFEGSLTGVIGNDKEGREGFGYDPIFYLPEKGCTLAQLSLDEKNEMSHRAVAFGMLKRFLARYAGRSAAW